jgi:hypothetical protein
MITIPFRVNQLTLAGLEAWIRLADNVGTATGHGGGRPGNPDDGSSVT